MSRVAISFINPLHFVEVRTLTSAGDFGSDFNDDFATGEPLYSGEIPQYRSRHMEDWWLEERINKWQSLPSHRWYQPWQNNDVISLQFQNNMGQIKVDIIDCDKKVLQTLFMTQKHQNTHEPGLFIYESDAALTTVPEGPAWALVRIGSSPVKKTLISEPFYIQESHEGTLLIEYWNYEYYQNFIFETGMRPSIRVRGLLRKKPTATKDTIYEDQDLDMVMVQSKPYRIWELIIGTEDGIPDWFEDKLARILGCSNLKIDGRYYTKNEGAKLEESDDRFFGTLKTYSIELRERINRNSAYFDSLLTDTNEELFIQLNTTSKGFADTSEDASSTITTFMDVE